MAKEDDEYNKFWLICSGNIILTDIILANDSSTMGEGLMQPELLDKH